MQNKSSLYIYANTPIKMTHCFKPFLNKVTGNKLLTFTFSATLTRVKALAQLIAVKEFLPYCI
jgi:hypothetical protein